MGDVFDAQYSDPYDEMFSRTAPAPKPKPKPSVAAVYRVKRADGKWARRGFLWGKQGKCWAGKRHLSCALTNYVQSLGIDRTMKREKADNILLRIANDEGWLICELSESGVRWLTLQEYFEL